MNYHKKSRLFIYQVILDLSTKILPLLLPKKILTEDKKIGKNSLYFKLYLLTLDTYLYILAQVRSGPSNYSKEFQLMRLKKISKQASKSTWWNNYFKKNNFIISEINTLEYLQKLPPVNRLNLFSESQESLLTINKINKDFIQINKTSGTTTGTPFAVLFYKSVSLLNITAFYIQALRDYGFNFDKNKYKNFFAHYNLFGGVQKLNTAPEQFAIPFSIKSSENSDNKMKEIVSEINSVDGAVLFTHPTELFSFVQKVKELNLTVHIDLCLIIGQTIEDEILEICETFLKCKTMSIYGFREMMIVAVECKDNRGFFHAQSERAIIEILDEATLPVKYGESGNITVTSLDNFLMPLIRYQPGDIGYFIETDCSCLNKSPLFKIENRTTDLVAFQDGTKKSVQKFFKKFERNFFFSNIKRYQLIQTSLTEAVFIFEKIKTAESDLIVEKITKIIGTSKFFPDEFRLEIREVEKIEVEENKKYSPFVSKITTIN